MNVLKITATALAISLIGSAFSANAEGSFETTFNYDTSMSAEQNYAVIQKTARKACDRAYQVRKSAYPQAYRRMTKRCAEEVVRDAIEAFNVLELTALHNRSQIKQANTTNADRA